MAAGAAGAAAAAAAAAERARKEEEEMTRYTAQDLNEDWEFKILRCVTGRFRDPIWLHGILQEEARHSITIQQIQRRVAEHFDVRVADMTSKRRPASIAFPRQVAMYLARELTKASLNEIGDAFGGRDHGTVLHACKLVKKRIAEQDNIRQTISYIDSSLQR